VNEKKIESIIKAYRSLKNQHPDVWLSDCENAEALDHAIETAATAKNSAGKKHSHQHRIPNAILDQFAIRILGKVNEVAGCTDFHSLLSIIERCKIKGISELTIYDTAQRIGCYLKIHPERIYLHRGTRKGAEILLGKIKNKYITINQLPRPFHSNLSAAEIEDILCIYKIRLATCV
jgi:hypothetical protein